MGEEWCATRPNCASGTDPTKVNQVFREPTLSYGSRTTGAIQAMYSEELWALLKTGLTVRSRVTKP